VADAAAYRSGGRRRGGQVEARQDDLDGLDGPGGGALGRGAPADRSVGVELGDAHDRVDAVEEEVPAALALGGEAVGQRAAGVGGSALAVPHEGPEGVLRGVGGDAVDPVRGDEAAGDVPALGALVELEEERGVRVAAHVVEEVRLALRDVELGEDDVPHRHGEGAVGAGGDPEPLVGELRVVGVVGGDGDDLLTPVPCLGHEVGVRGPGLRHVRAPHDQVRGVPPVCGLGYIGLVTEHLR